MDRNMDRMDRNPRDTAVPPKSGPPRRQPPSEVLAVLDVAIGFEGPRR